MHRTLPALAAIAALAIPAQAAARTPLLLRTAARQAERLAADTKHYSTFRVSQPTCRWIARPKPPNYAIIPTTTPGLALCKLVVTERFQLINPDTGRVAGYTDPTRYPLLVSIAAGRAAVYHGGAIS